MCIIGYMGWLERFAPFKQAKQLGSIMSQVDLKYTDDDSQHRIGVVSWEVNDGNKTATVFGILTGIVLVLLVPTPDNPIGVVAKEALAFSSALSVALLGSLKSINDGIRNIQMLDVKKNAQPVRAVEI